MKTAVRCVVLVLAAVGCFGARGEAPPAGARMRETPEALAARISPEFANLLPEHSELRVRIESGRIYCWTVAVDETLGVRELAKLINAPPDLEDERVLSRWGEALNTLIYARTREEVVRAQLDPSFNPETDIWLHVCCTEYWNQEWAWKLPGGIYGERSVRFVGSTRFEWDTPQVESTAGGPLQISIELPRTTWERGETIRGTIRTRNAGTTRLPISNSYLGFVEVQDRFGSRAPQFDRIACRYPSADGPGTTFLNAGEEKSSSFSIVTDELAATGYRLDVGTWRVVPSLRQYPQFRVDFEPAEFAVRPIEGRYDGPRLLRVESFGDKIVAHRERSIIEVIDLAAMTRSGAVSLSDRRLGWGTHRSVLSADGRLGALQSARDTVLVFSLDGGLTPIRTLHSPPGLEDSGLYPRAFSADGMLLHCSTNDGWAMLDIASNALKSRARTPRGWVHASPDLRFAVHVRTPDAWGPAEGRAKDSTVTIVDLDDPDSVREVTVAAKGSGRREVHGASGVYLSDPDAGAICFVSFKKEEVRSLPVKNADPVAESADGTLLMCLSPSEEASIFFNSPKDASAVVVDAATGEELARIPLGTTREAVLLDSPSRVLVMQKRFVSVAGSFDGSWIDEKVRLYDARTGKDLGERDLTPKPGSIGAGAAPPAAAKTDDER